MDERQHPLEELQKRERNRSQIESYLTRSKAFLQTFLQRKTGVAGLLLLFIVVAIGITGNSFKNPPSSVYSGQQAFPKAPSWTRFWGQKPVNNHILVNHNFEGDQHLSYENRLEIKRKVNTDKIHVHCDIQNNHLTFNFSEIRRNETYSTFKSETSALIVASSSFQWDYDNHPNGYEFQFDYKTLRRSLNNSRRTSQYDWSFTTYIKSRKVNNMQLFLQQISNIDIPEELYTHPYGIQLTSSLPNINSTSWNRKESSLPRRIWTEIFESFSDFEINFVATLKLEDPTSAPRSPSELSIHIDNIELIGNGYHGGLLGTTPTGHDLYSLIAVGVKNSFLLGFVTSSIMLSLGLLLGLASGYYRGTLDEITMRVADVLLSIPNLPIMMVLTTLFSKSGIGRVWGIIIVIAFMSWARPARFIRSQVISERENPYIETAKASGVPVLSIIFTHLLPNVFGVILYQVIISLQRVVLITAGLSFLGLGPPNWLSLGKIIQYSIIIQEKHYAAFQFWSNSFFPGWWFVFFPGFTLVLLLLGLLFIGITLQDIYQLSSNKF